MNDRVFRLGFNLGTAGLTPAGVADLARDAERLGYDCIWAAEVAGADPVPLLGWLAGQTSSIGLGTAVLQISGRSPVAAATGAAMLDRLSGGRFRLGLGTSGPQVVEGWYGQPYARPLARTRDYVAVVRMALAGKPVSYRGATMTLPMPGGEATAMPVLSASPNARRVPVYLAALGPRSIALAGEISDGWMGIHCPPGYLARARAWLAEGAARAGRAPGEISAAVMVCAHVDEDVTVAREMVRPMLAMFLGGMGTKKTNFYNRLAVRLGYGAEAALIQDLFLNGSTDEAIAAVSDEMVDEMTVCGPPDAVRRRLAAYRDAGASTVIAGLAAPSVQMRREQLEVLAELGQSVGPVPARSPGKGPLPRRPAAARPLNGELAVSEPAGTDSGHLVPLPGTEWKAWRHALLRTTGFPVEGLDRLCAEAAAQRADACLLGSGTREEFDRAYAEAEPHSSAAVRVIAADPLFREAIAWQNPSVLAALDALARAAPGRRANRKDRRRERTVARYWQRYCAKTETIGFFGPVCWVTLDPDGPAVRAVPGPGLLRDRRVYLEHWAVAQYAEVVASDLQARRWLAPMLQPHLVVRDGRILQPARPPTALTSAELAVISRMDGRRPALEIATGVVADPSSGLRKADDVYLLLERMVSRGVIRWDFNIPVHADCERFLRDRIAAIGDADVRSQAEAGLDRLSRAREKVAAAAGDPGRLPLAISQLEAEFTSVSHHPAERKAGQMYAARRIYWEEATRDLNVAFGQPVLEAIAGPLAVLAQAARWLTAALADEYLRALRDLYAELADELGSAQVPLGQLWFLSQGLFYGSAERPADRVTAEFTRRWADLFQTSSAAMPGSAVHVTSAALLAKVGQIFPAQRPGWPDARIHSPDLQICAESVDAIQRGDFTVVLGELHAAWATNAIAMAVSGFGDPGELAAALTADLGSGRIHPLLPSDWPRNTPRLAFALGDDSDVQLGILPAPGANPDRLLPVSAVSVSDVAGELAASTADGRSWPLTTIFARPLSEVSVEIFKLVGVGPHTPRIVIDRLTVARETWRTTVGECGLTKVGASGEAFLAVRRWRLALGLPERVFVKIDTEVKPFFVDFRAPLYVASLLHMLRAAEAQSGGDVPVCVTEMLPTPQEAWLPDASGQRYLSELRLHIRDPARPRGWPG